MFTRWQRVSSRKRLSVLSSRSYDSEDCPPAAHPARPAPSQEVQLSANVAQHRKRSPLRTKAHILPVLHSPKTVIPVVVILCLSAPYKSSLNNAFRLPRLQLNPEGRLNHLPETWSADTTTQEICTQAGGVQNVSPLLPPLPPWSKLLLHRKTEQWDWWFETLALFWWLIFTEPVLWTTLGVNFFSDHY